MLDIGCNAGFFRKDAFLYTVLVSDEDDEWSSAVPAFLRRKK